MLGLPHGSFFEYSTSIVAVATRKIGQASKLEYAGDSPSVPTSETVVVAKTQGHGRSCRRRLIVTVLATTTVPVFGLIPWLQNRG